MRTEPLRKVSNVEKMRRIVLATLVSLPLLGVFSLAEQKPPLRVEPGAPPGKGGELIISVEPQLCAQADLLVRLEREDVQQSGTLWNVFETPLGKPCSWTVGDLWPGNYHLVVQRGSSGYAAEIFVNRSLTITAGVRAAEALYSDRTEISGLVTIDGARTAMLEGLPLMFRRPNEVHKHAEIIVNNRGEYHGYLNFAGDVQLILRNVLFSKFIDLKVEPGFTRYDLDLPPGLIKVIFVPPPGLTTEYRIRCAVAHEAPTQHPRQRPEISRVDSQIFMDKAQTYFIAGKGYGRYTIRAGTDARDPADSKPLLETVVNLTAEEPHQEVVLDLSEVQLLPTPMRPSNIEKCPPPRTIACVHGSDPR